MTASLTRSLVAALLLALPATSARAQMYPFSQRGSVMQRVAFTQVSLEYGRPTARGRALFGALVPWNAVWNPGADNATSITFDHDVLLESQPVKAGTYTVWLLPRESAPWTFILSRATNVSHTPYPGVAQDVLRVDVMPTTGSHLESLTFLFPSVLREEATLRMQWGETGVTVRLRAPWRPESGERPALQVAPVQPDVRAPAVRLPGVR